MQKITLSVAKILASVLAINAILEQKGAGKYVYWLKRNLDRIEKIDKSFRFAASKQFDEAAISVPGPAYIPMEKYEECKKDLISLDTSTKENILAILTKHEVKTQPNGKTMEPADLKAFNDRISKEAEEKEEEIEYTPIIFEPKLDAVLMLLPGAVMASICWMIDENSLAPSTEEKEVV